jgi:hypothetical protein
VVSPQTLKFIETSKGDLGKQIFVKIGIVGNLTTIAFMKMPFTKKGMGNFE